MKTKWILILLLFNKLIFAHNNTVLLQFFPNINSENISLNKAYIIEKDTFIFKNIKFYISNIELYNGNKKVFSEKKSIHLIDLKDSICNTLNIKIPKNLKFNSIRFGLGIDSITNDQADFKGDLEPQKGMYWAWQSGFINFKIIGEKINQENNKTNFEYHIGGFLYGFNAYKKLNFKLQNPQNNLNFKIDLTSLMTSKEIQKTNNILSPSIDAVKISEAFANSFLLWP